MIRKIAKKIRHSKILNSQEWLWSLFRRPYFFLLDPLQKGVHVNIGGLVEVRMPGDLTGLAEWETYEQENIKRFISWLHSSENPLILDIGSALGIFSLVALAAKPTAKAIAFESNLQSIAVSQYLMRHYRQDRFQVIQGLIGAPTSRDESFAVALEKTSNNLRFHHKKPPKSSSKYICLDDPEGSGVPKYSLDGLFAGIKLPAQKVLIKIDVEGAELLVLKGAKKFIQEHRPDLFLSAHPPALPRYGHSLKMLEQEIRKLGYEKEIISEDHEIHFFCQAEKT